MLNFTGEETSVQRKLSLESQASAFFYDTMTLFYSYIPMRLENS